MERGAGGGGADQSRKLDRDCGDHGRGAGELVVGAGARGGDAGVRGAGGGGPISECAVIRPGSMPRAEIASHKPTYQDLNLRCRD
jgi:hypothetical protein